MKKANYHRRGRPKNPAKMHSVCPYSDSCFTCPKSDCVADYDYNEILDSETYLQLLGH